MRVVDVHHELVENSKTNQDGFDYLDNSNAYYPLDCHAGTIHRVVLEEEHETMDLMDDGNAEEVEEVYHYR